MNLLIICGGNMGGAIAKALLNGKKRLFESVFVCDSNQEKLGILKKLGAKTLAELDRDVVGKCDVILLAVKPQDFSTLLSSLRHFLNTGKPKLILSIAAGIPISFIRSYLSTAHIIRIMPNTPALIGKGISAWTADRKVPPTEKKIAKTLLQTM